MPTVMQCIGTPNARHNLDIHYRSFLDNVVPELSKYNEIVRHRTVEDIYAERLQPAFDEFNERQKRKDRRLDVKYGCDTFLEYQRILDKKAKESDNSILKQGRPPIREIVLQIGNPEQGYGCRNQTEESRQQIKEMLLEVQDEMEKRYPQLAWGDIVFHADEVSYDADGKEHGSIHLHSSFVPLCYKNKQGPKVQVALERCLNEMGFSTFEEWKHDLDQIMEEVLERHYLERTLADNHEKHGSSTEWHRQQKIIKQTRDLEFEKKKLESIIEEYNQDIDDKYDTINQLDRDIDDKNHSLMINREKSRILKEDINEQEMALQSLISERDKISLEASEWVSKTQERIEALDIQESTLESNIKGLKGQLKDIHEQIYEADAELSALKAAINQTNAKGSAKFGSMAEWKEQVRDYRARQQQEEKQSFFQRFFEFCKQHFPKIVELFMQQEREKDSRSRKKKMLNQDENYR